MKFITLFLSALLLCGCLFFTACDLSEVNTVENETLSEETEINTKTEIEVVTEAEIETEIISESTVMRMLKRLGFTNIDEEILKTYIPTYDYAINVEKEGLQVAKLTTLWCGCECTYYIVVNKAGEVIKISSTETDYDSRITYYPKEQQED